MLISYGHFYLDHLKLIYCAFIKYKRKKNAVVLSGRVFLYLNTTTMIDAATSPLDAV